jgi:thioester reductase-like protein
VSDSAGGDVTGNGISLVTGFPGFIGRRLVERLLNEDGGRRIVALVEERAAENARAAAGELDPERLEVLAGDITDRRLGLDDDDYERLRAQTTTLFHLAAVYDLAVPADIAQRVNVDGTGNVLELCAGCEQLERLVYVSTAYVSGLRTGTVYEHELAMGQGFKNHYESTKFQAEVWVRSRMDRVPTAILRPAIVVGDSTSGETQKFDGPYYLLRTISRTRRSRLPIMRFGAADSPFNVVPVDYIVAAIAATAREPAALGETLHLVDPDPLTTRELVDLLAREYASRPARARIPPRLAEVSLRLAPVRRAFGGVPPQSLRYLNHPVHYDTRRAVAVLGPHGLRPPRFPDYVGAMVEFFQDHEDDEQYAA